MFDTRRSLLKTAVVGGGALFLPGNRPAKAQVVEGDPTRIFLEHAFATSAARITMPILAGGPIVAGFPDLIVGLRENTQNLFDYYDGAKLLPSMEQQMVASGVLDTEPSNVVHQTAMEMLIQHQFPGQGRNPSWKFPVDRRKFPGYVAAYHEMWPKLKQMVVVPGSPGQGLANIHATILGEFDDWLKEIKSRLKSGAIAKGVRGAQLELAGWGRCAVIAIGGVYGATWGVMAAMGFATGGLAFGGMGLAMAIGGMLCL